MNDVRWFLMPKGNRLIYGYRRADMANSTGSLTEVEVFEERRNPSCLPRPMKMSINDKNGEWPRRDEGANARLELPWTETTRCSLSASWIDPSVSNVKGATSPGEARLLEDCRLTSSCLNRASKTRLVARSEVFRLSSTRSAGFMSLYYCIDQRKSAAVSRLLALRSSPGFWGGRWRKGIIGPSEAP